MPPLPIMSFNVGTAEHFSDSSSISSTTRPEEDLTGYVHTQEEAIRKLSVHPEKPLCALEPRLSFWETFRDSFWGKGLGISQEEENVERGNEPVDLCNIADPLPPTRRVIKPSEDVSDTWGSWGQRFLVRSEYYETEQAATLASKIMDVFVVTGQPGIGLPLSLSVVRGI